MPPYAANARPAWEVSMRLGRARRARDCWFQPTPPDRRPRRNQAQRQTTRDFKAATVEYMVCTCMLPVPYSWAPRPILCSWGYGCAEQERTRKSWVPWARHFQPERPPVGFKGKSEAQEAAALTLGLTTETTLCSRPSVSLKPTGNLPGSRLVVSFAQKPRQ